jgi:hypothetical protein
MLITLDVITIFFACVKGVTFESVIVEMVKHGALTCMWKIIVVGINMVTHNNYQEC